MEVEMSGESAAALESELVARRPWGTWEELVLGGALLRHGTANWEPVAAELRLRFPYPFTPQECEAKYADVQVRFSGFGAWFEELRRQRVEDLRRELEQSEDSIGSLHLKLETLKAERESDQSRDYSSGNTNSPFPIENAEGTELCSKEPSNDRSSAGSFIEETRCAWSPGPHIADSISAQDVNMEESKDSTWHMFASSGNVVVVPGSLRKKRGARKRRFHSDAKEGSTGVSNSVSSMDVNREESKGFSIQNTGPGNRVPNCEHSGQHSIGRHQDLEGILDELLKHESASLFHRQLESQVRQNIASERSSILILQQGIKSCSQWLLYPVKTGPTCTGLMKAASHVVVQKKARYRKMIRRHVDFQFIRSRISDGAISSAREVLRDLLLLSNNALVFYPKQSCEYKSAITLRQLVSEALRKDRSLGTSNNVAANAESKMVRPEAGESPCSHKATVTELKSGRTLVTKKASNSKKVLATETLPASPPKKRRVGRPAKSSSHQGPRESPVKGRKVRR